MVGWPLNLVEFLTLAAAAAFATIIVKKRMVAESVVFLTAVGTVTCGELFNEFVSQAAVYAPAYLLRLPGTRIPVFIALGGATLSVGIYMASVRIPSPPGFAVIGRLWAPLMVPPLSIPLLLVEIAGIKLGMWGWARPPVSTPDWLLGVWKFYFIFVASPAMVPGLARQCWLFFGKFLDFIDFTDIKDRK